jgi:hypothetical protein
MPVRRRKARGIALLTLFLALAATNGYAAAAPHRHHQSKLHGRWTNPVGACVQHIIKFDPATGDVTCTGTSKWTGTWTGSTKWKLTGNQNLTTGAGSGRIDEVFTGSAGRGRKHRKGKLTFVEKMTLADGKISIRGHIVKSSHGLAGSSGHAVWTGTTSVTDGSGKGKYAGRWRQGED